MLPPPAMVGWVDGPGTLLSVVVDTLFISSFPRTMLPISESSLIFDAFGLFLLLHLLVRSQQKSDFIAVQGGDRLALVIETVGTLPVIVVAKVANATRRTDNGVLDSDHTVNLAFDVRVRPFGKCRGQSVFCEVLRVGGEKGGQSIFIRVRTFLVHHTA